MSIEIKNFRDYKSFKETHQRAIVFYGSKDCDACIEFKPLYERIANRYHDLAAFAYVDINVCVLNFSTVPVFVSFLNGVENNNMEGVSVPHLKAFIKAAIKAK